MKELKKVEKKVDSGTKENYARKQFFSPFLHLKSL